MSFGTKKLNGVDVSIEAGDPNTDKIFGKIKKLTTNLEYIHVAVDGDKYTNLMKVIIDGEQFYVDDVKERAPITFSNVDITFVNDSNGYIAKVQT